MSDVTTLLNRWNEGDAEALKELVGVVHGELRRLAGSLLRHERRDHTLQPTELVHEVYLRLTGLRDLPLEGATSLLWSCGRGDAAILVDHARHRDAQKRGGPDVQRVPIDCALNVPIDLRIDFVRLDEAILRLAAAAPDKAKVVELRYFGGLSIQETAEVLGIAPVTVKRHWTFARAWLHRALSE